MLTHAPAPSHAEYERLTLARDMMNCRFRDPLSVARLADEVHFSRFHFIRLFRATYGLTPHRYLVRLRIEEAKRLLAASDLPVTEVCFTVGFESPGSFSARFHRETGSSPAQYRQLLAARRTFVPGCFLVMSGVRSS